MIKYLCIGLLFSGALSLENYLSCAFSMAAVVPDVGLIWILVYSARGRGRILIPLCFLWGWIKGCGTSDPAGIYILSYLAVGYLLFKTRSFFFIERPLTQFVLCIFCGLFYWLLIVLCRRMGWLWDPGSDMLIRQVYACISAAFFAPLVIFLYDRLVFVRKRFHP